MTGWAKPVECRYQPFVKGIAIEPNIVAEDGLSGVGTVFF